MARVFRHYSTGGRHPDKPHALRRQVEIDVVVVDDGLFLDPDRADSLKEKDDLVQVGRVDSAQLGHFYWFSSWPYIYAA